MMGKILSKQVICLESKHDENLLVGKINNFREELEKLGLEVPPKLIN